MKSINVDHRASEAQRGRHHLDKTASGRVKSAFDPVDEDRRERLSRKLGREIEGEVRFDTGSRALYATDASNYRQVPLGVVLPKSADDVERTMRLCSEEDVPVLPRGGGTSLAGEGCNVAVMLDFSKYLHGVKWVDPQRKLAQVEPGCILDTLRDAAEEHGLTFGPDPATHDHNTLGGMIGNNSCGVHSVMAGRTSDNVDALEILTYDGLRMWVGPTSPAERQKIDAEGGRRAEIYRDLDRIASRYGSLIRQRFPKIPRRVSGYENLDELLPEKGFNVARALVGTEGTCVTVLSATLNLVASPAVRVLVILGFDDIFAAADAVPEVLEFKPVGLEGLDHLLIEFVRRKNVHPEDLQVLPEGQGWLVAEFGGADRQTAEAHARKLMDRASAKGWSAKLVADKSSQAHVWELRESALAATAHVPGMPESWPGWEDSAVPREALGDYLRQFKSLLSRHGYEASVYGHFGDGLVHCRIPFGLRTKNGIANWQAFLDEAADLVVQHGGSLSGEHGDGQARAALLEKMYGPELMQAFREFKAIWDPRGRMNPGKVVDPFPIESNLRVGPDYRPEEVSHHFAYPDDGGSFTKAMLRCVGVGACRRTDSDKGVMCPSYMVTREERHSTRGRARLLFEMLHGGAIRDGWESAEVEEALDLCLACKGCKHDCPVSVDMATYKAEFRSHHYAHRWRPRSAYSMGLIHRWSRLAEASPWLVNLALQTKGISDVAKWIGGIAPGRTIPRYASRTFTGWFHSRSRQHPPARQAPAGRILLWPDTFSNHFRVETAIAATRLLEHLGYEVVVPRENLCCGRPLYDWGWIDAAKSLWRRTFDVLAPEIAAGTPMVGLEPSCVSAFRDELPGLFPKDKAAQRLSRRMKFLTEHLDARGADIGGDPSQVPALVQLHCHHHAVLDAEAERRVLQNAGIDANVLPSGCCGMAGAFGFESEKYDLSIAAAERILLPRIRQASADTLIIANGFSCREQIEQQSGRQTRHVAEVLARRIPGGCDGV
ncbi:MAG: FAD-binding and (Fe-S)-binding domain-containing protein [Hyphomicrobiaceae bacterium]